MVFWASSALWMLTMLILPPIRAEKTTTTTTRAKDIQLQQSCTSLNLPSVSPLPQYAFAFCNPFMASQQMSVVGVGSNRQTNWTCKRLKAFCNQNEIFSRAVPLLICVLYWQDDSQILHWRQLEMCEHNYPFYYADRKRKWVVHDFCLLDLIAFFSCMFWRVLEIVLEIMSLLLLFCV